MRQMQLKELLNIVHADVVCLNPGRLPVHEQDSITLITQSLKSFDELEDNNEAGGYIFVKPTFDLNTGLQPQYDASTADKLLSLPLAALFVDDQGLVNSLELASYPVFSLSKTTEITTNRLFGQLCTHFYGYPQKSFEQLIGVTGTNGKTTTTHMIAKVLSDAQLTIGLIGTLGYRCNTGAYVKTDCTTPYASLLQKIFARMKNDDHIDHVVMEVSSYSLTLERIYGCQFSMAVFTNFTQDHLAFHHMMENYLQAKLTLFSDYLNRSSSPIAILNRDDPVHEQFARACPANTKIYTYGVTSQSDNAFIGSDVHTSFDGTSFTVRSPLGETKRVRLKVHGTFNVYNALACLAACYTMHSNTLSLDQIVTSLENYPCAKARFEFILRRQPFSVVIDDANTPNGLEKALQCGRDIVREANENGRVIVLFGCNGRGDQSKRPLMGRAADENAHIVIITSSNPRQEDPQKIIDDILSGVQPNQIGKRIYTETDRTKAIHLAMDLAKDTNDLVILAGKGHDTTQSLAHGVIPFNETHIVKAKYDQMMSASEQRHEMAACTAVNKTGFSFV